MVEKQKTIIAKEKGFFARVFPRKKDVVELEEEKNALDKIKNHLINMELDNAKDTSLRYDISRDQIKEAALEAIVELLKQRRDANVGMLSSRYHLKINEIKLAAKEAFNQLMENKKYGIALEISKGYGLKKESKLAINAIINMLEHSPRIDCADHLIKMFGFTEEGEKYGTIKIDNSKEQTS